MKKFCLFVAFLICNFSLFAQTQDLPDTVWTKMIFPEEVVGVMFSPDGSQVYVSTDQRVWIISTLTGDSIRTIRGTGAFKVMSSDYKYIYTSKYKKLDATTFQILDSLKNLKYISYQYHDLTLTADDKFILSVGVPGNSINNPNYSLMKINTETMEVGEYIDYPGAMNHVATSPDGKYFVTDWGNGIFMTKDHTDKLLLWDAKTFKFIKEIYSDTVRIGYMKFSPNNKFLCVNLRGHLTFFETVNYKYVNKFTDYQLNDNGTFEFTKNSQFVVSGAEEIIVVSDANKILNSKVYNYPIFGNYVAISSNQNYIIAGGGYYISMLNYKTSISDVKSNEFSNFNLIINPNPVNSSSKIIFTNKLSDNFEINIKDILNKTIATIYKKGFLESGEHTFVWNTLNIPNGIYYCNVIGNNLNLSTKIIVGR